MVCAAVNYIAHLYLPDVDQIPPLWLYGQRKITLSLAVRLETVSQITSGVLRPMEAPTRRYGLNKKMKTSLAEKIFLK